MMREKVMGAESLREPKQLQRREAVAAWVSSGKPLQEYCGETGQSHWALRRWRLKFAEELGIPIRRRPGAAKANRTKVSPKVPSTWVPIEIDTSSESRNQAARIEIRLRGDRTVVVCAGIDTATLSRLVVAIERAA